MLQALDRPGHAVEHAPAAHHGPAAKPESSGTWRKGEFVLIGDVLTPVLGALVWLALFVVAVLFAMQVMAQTGTPPAAFNRMMLGLMRQPAAVQVVTATSDLVILYFLWRIARRVAGGSLIARFRRVRRVVLVLALLGGAALAVGTLVGSAELAAHSIIHFHPAPGDRLFTPGAPYQYLIAFAAIGGIAPFVEEFYFRGILLSWLGRKITVIPAALVSAAIFALLHFRFSSHPGLEGWLLTGVIALVGLINAALAIRTRSLWPPFVFHASYNSTLLVASLLPLVLR